MLDSAVLLKYDNATTSLTFSEQLYTASGTQGISFRSDFYKFNDRPRDELIKLQVREYAPTDNGSVDYIDTRVFSLRQIYIWQDDRIKYADGMRPKVSIPMLAFYSGEVIGVGDLTYDVIGIDFTDAMDYPTFQQFKRDFSKALSASTFFYDEITEYEPATIDDKKTLSTEEIIANAMNKAFNAIIIVTMLLCFFALSSNMSANILEQTKEIGVLRAMGFRRFRIMLLYFYEATVLILSSCLMGVMIGMVVGYTMTVQESLILGMELPIFFPFSQFIVILILTFVCAIMATFTPSYKLTKLEISQIFRLI